MPTTPLERETPWPVASQPAGSRLVRRLLRALGGVLGGVCLVVGLADSSVMAQQLVSFPTQQVPSQSGWTGQLSPSPGGATSTWTTPANMSNAPLATSPLNGAATGNWPTQPIQVSQVPSASLGGTIQPNYGAATWDPFADSANQAPMLNSGMGQPFATQPAPFGQQPYYGQQPYNDGVVPQAMRLLQQVRAHNTWLAGKSGNGFMNDDLELSATFGIPNSWSMNHAPILITPGFTFHWWGGPESAPGVQQDLPPRVYDAYLATSWQPQFTPRFGADLALAVGVYSDFQYVNSDSFRILGRGLGTWAFNERVKGALGVMYLDRLNVKLLPAGGVIWTPNTDTRYEILFPNPKLSQRITNIGNSELWGYVAGEYGGGMWTVEHANGLREPVNYDDLRLILGVETAGHARLKGLFEVGYVWDRKIIYGDQNFNIRPSDTVMLRTGFSY